MPMLIRDRSKGAHQLLQLKYGMLNILSSPKIMYSFDDPPPLLQIYFGFIGSKKSSSGGGHLLFV